MAPHEKQHETTSYQCDDCHKIFSAPRNLSEHKKTHELPATATCEICSNVLSHPGNLKKHMKNVHGHTFHINGNNVFHMTDNISNSTAPKAETYCKFCQKFFSKPANLKKHMQVKHETSNDRIYFNENYFILDQPIEESCPLPPPIEIITWRFLRFLRYC